MLCVIKGHCHILLLTAPISQPLVIVDMVKVSCCKLYVTLCATVKAICDLPLSIDESQHLKDRRCEVTSTRIVVQCGDVVSSKVVYLDVGVFDDMVYDISLNISILLQRRLLFGICLSDLSVAS